MRNLALTNDPPLEEVGNPQSKILFHTAAFLVPFSGFGIHFSQYFLPICYILVLIDARFWYQFVAQKMLSKKSIPRLSILVLLACFFCIHSAALLNYFSKILLITLFVIYFSYGFLKYGSKLMLYGAIAGVFFATLQFLDANLFRNGALSLEHFRMNWTSNFGFGLPYGNVGSYAPGVIFKLRHILRVSGPMSEPSYFCASLLALLGILNQNPLYRCSFFFGLVLAFSKIVVIQLAALIVWPLVKRLPISLAFLLIAMTYFFAGYLYFYHDHLHVSNHTQASNDAHAQDYLALQKAKPTLYKTGVEKRGMSDLLLENIKNKHPISAKEDFNLLKNLSVKQRFSSVLIYRQYPLLPKLFGAGGRNSCKYIYHNLVSTNLCVAADDSSIGSLLLDYGFLGILIVFLLLRWLAKKNKSEVSFPLYLLIISTLTLSFPRFFPAHYALIAYTLCLSQRFNFNLSNKETTGE